MRVGSLFTGIGGFDLGFERAGFEVAWQCEIDVHARKVLRAHWPEVPCFEDVSTLEGAAVPRVDVLCGGFPCQDVSVAGQRAGLAGGRSGLWHEFRRLIGELRPSWVVIENVPGLRTSNRGNDFATVLRGLAELGYMGGYGSLDAQWFGLAQRRERVFFVGHLGDGRASAVLPFTESLLRNPPSRGEEEEAVAKRLGNSSQSGGFRTTDLDHGTYVLSRRGRDGGTADEVESRAPTVVSFAENQRGELREMEIAPALGGGGGKPGSGYVAVYDLPEGTENGALTTRTMIATGARDVEAGAIQLDQGRPRRLTPRECERLQGFPDDWTAGQSDTHRYKQLGNAVAVPVIEWLARRIRQVDQ